MTGNKICFHKIMRLFSIHSWKRLKLCANQSFPWLKATGAFHGLFGWDGPFAFSLTKLWCEHTYLSVGEPVWYEFQPSVNFQPITNHIYDFGWSPSIRDGVLRSGMLLYLHHINFKIFFHPAKFDNFKDEKISDFKTVSASQRKNLLDWKLVV